MKTKTAARPPIFDSSKWCWDTANLLAQDYLRFFNSTGGIGKLELFYRETTTLCDGTVQFIPSHINNPLGTLSTGFSTRGEFTREQLTVKVHDILRRLPCLPISGELMAQALKRQETK